MNQSEFIKYLEEESIKYEINDNVISILGDIDGYVSFKGLVISLGVTSNSGSSTYSYKSIQNKRNIESTKNIHFNNSGDVNLGSIDSLPENTQFNNGGYVDLSSLKYLSENTQFNNGGSVFLDSLESLPESTQFNNGIFIFLNSLKSWPKNFRFNNDELNNELKNDYTHLKYYLKQKKSYVERNRLEVKDDKVILYKKVSKDFLTQEGNDYETRWKIGSTLILTHPDWDPKKNECGPGKFHACARPFWCDHFRNRKSDRYIAVEVDVKDLHEWEKVPAFPQKIAFRCGKVLYECDRYGNKV